MYSAPETEICPCSRFPVKPFPQGNLDPFREAATNTYLASTWNVCYTGIQRCNIALSRIDGISMNETLRNTRNNDVIECRIEGVGRDHRYERFNNTNFIQQNALKRHRRILPIEIFSDVTVDEVARAWGKYYAADWSRLLTCHTLFEGGSIALVTRPALTTRDRQFSNLECVRQMVSLEVGAIKFFALQRRLIAFTTNKMFV